MKKEPVEAGRGIGIRVIIFGGFFLAIGLDGIVFHVSPLGIRDPGDALIGSIICTVAGALATSGGIALIVAAHRRGKQGDNGPSHHPNDDDQSD